MKRFCDMTRDERRSAMRDMLRGLGVDVPDDVEPRRVVVHGDDGQVITSYWLGLDTIDDNQRDGGQRTVG